MAKRRANNEGSITQRKDGRWMARVTTGYCEEGKPIRKHLYGRSSQEVKDLLVELQYKIQTGTYESPSRLTVGEWLDSWLKNYVSLSLRPTTWANYETQVRKHLKPHIGKKKLTQLRTGDLQKIYNLKVTDGLKPKTIKNIHNVIHSALEQAKKEGIITINPADAVILPKPGIKEMATLGVDEMKHFLAAAKNSKHYAAYLLELATGLRRGELLGLKWPDLDLKSGTVTVNRGLVRAKGQGLIFQEPKTHYSRRTISIPLQVARELERHKAKQNIDKLELGKAYYNDNLVFCTKEGKPLDPSEFTRHFQRLLKAAGLPRLRFHDLRHTFATVSLQEGVSAKVIQEVLGHHSAAFTMQVYSHVTEKMKREATDKIGAVLNACIGE